MILFESLDADDARKLNDVIARELKTELMECETPDGDYDFSIHFNRFPSFAPIQHRDRCNRVLPELYHMSLDGYDHHLSPLYEFVLSRCLQEWRDVAEDRVQDTVDEQEQRENAAYHELLKYFAGGEPFEDSDFDNAENLANAILRGTNLLEEFGVTHDEIRDLFEVMPADIARDIERRFAAASRRSSEGH